MADGATAYATACGVTRIWPPAAAGPFRDGLSKLASGVAVVACWAEGQPRGLLVSSFTGLSITPPRLLFCVRKAANAHLALLHADAVGVSLLHKDDREEAARFSCADRAPERFAPDRWRLEANAPPTRKDALAVFIGPLRARIDAGTHTVFILDASQVDVGDAEPLLYFDRDFRDLA